MTPNALLPVFGALLLIWTPSHSTLAQSPSPPEVHQTLLAAARDKGTVRIIVGLRTEPTFRYEGRISSPTTVAAQRAAILRAQIDLLNDLSADHVKVHAQYRRIPHIALEVSESALRRLMRSPRVATISEDIAVPPSLSTSIPVIGADDAWAMGFTGSGQAVGILDTGVESSHPFLGGRVVSEACFSTTYAPESATTLCPNAQESMIGPGAASPVTCSGIGGCEHGTHVAGIAAGSGTSFHGVARAADILAIQVFSRFDDPTICGTSSCLLSYISDQVAALEHIYDIRNDFDIAAVNLSLGGGSYSTTCDGVFPAYTDAVATLQSVGIATVVSSGNNGLAGRTGLPGCITEAVTVGATTDADVVPSFSNSAAWVDLLAPGVLIESSVTGGGFAPKSGTSMAAPHVTGAWAVLKSADPEASVADLVDALQTTGVPVTDPKSGITTPRIQIDAALTQLQLPPRITTLSLPEGRVGTAYSTAIAVEGGLPPLTFARIAGALPPGLSGPGPSTGVISGTPSAAGIYAFSIRVTDAAGRTDEEMYSLLVRLRTPVLREPSNGTVTTNPRPTFSWDAVPGATHYLLQADNQTTGALLVIDESDLTDITFMPSTNLSDGDYRWRVQATDGTNASDFSADFAFELDTTAPSSVTLEGGVPPDYISVTGLTASQASGELTGYGRALAVDGEPGTFWSTPPRTALQNEYITIDTGSSRTIWGVRLTARHDTAILFPRDFRIQSSPGGQTFTTLAVEDDFVAEAGMTYTFELPLTTARFVRIYITESNRYGPNYYAQIAEVEILQAEPPFGAVELGWSAPGDDGNVGAATTYDIRYAAGDTIVFETAVQAVGEPIPRAAGTRQSFRLQGLDRETAYTVALQSIDNAGNASATSNAVTVTTRGEPPAPITSLVAAPAGLTRITLQWSAPFDDGPLGVRSYDVRFSASPISEANFLEAMPAPGAPPVPAAPGVLEQMSVENLDTNTVYYFAVRTEDFHGNVSALSNVASSSTLDTVAPAAINDLTGATGSGGLTPVSPLLALSASGELAPYTKEKVVDGDPSTFWSTPARVTQLREQVTIDLAGVHEIARVRLRPRNETSPFPRSFDIQTSVNGSAFTTALSVSNPNVTYGAWLDLDIAPVSARYVRISALGVLWGARYYVQIAEMDVEESYASPGSVTLRWTAPVEDAGDPSSGAVSSYEIRYSPGELTAGNFDGAALVSVCSGGADPCTSEPVTPLEPGTLQNVVIAGFGLEEVNHFMVKSIDLNGNFSFSNSASAASPGAPPDTVTDLEVIEPITGSSVTLRFTATFDDEGDTLSGPASLYEIRYSTQPITITNLSSANLVTPAPTPQVDPPNKETFEVTGLSNQTTYYFAVRAVDDAGNFGGISNVPSATTDDAIGPARITDLDARVASGFNEAPATVYGVSGQLAPYVAAMTVDGNPATFWSTPGRTAPMVEQITLDLGSPKNVGRVRMASRADTGILFPKDFNIQVGDGTTFTTVHSELDFTAGAGRWYTFDGFTPHIGRFVRIQVTESVLYSGRYYAQVAEIELAESVEGVVSVDWTSPGDDGDQGTATRYELRWSNVAITDTNFNAAQLVDPGPVPLEAGTSQSFLVQGLKGESNVYFAIKAFDEAGNGSPSSNSPMVTTPAIPPAAVDDLTATPVDATTIRLDWTATGDDGETGRAAAYEFRRSLSPITTDTEFAAATLITTGVPAPADAGTPQTMNVGSLQPDTTYYFAVKVSDLAGNKSARSNTAGAATIDNVAPAPITLSASTGGFIYEPRAATAVSSSGDLSSTFSKAKAVDSNPATFWSTPGRTIPVVEQITIDLGSSKNVGRVRLLSRADTGAVFPRDFNIQVSSDNINFTTVRSEQDVFVGPAVWLTLDFSPTAARFVRIEITETNKYGSFYYAQIAEIEAYEAMPGGVLLSWTAPGDNGTTGTASAYEIRYDDQTITEANFDAATLAGTPIPQPAGSAEIFNVPGLPPGTYYFRIRASDEAGNASLSTEATITVGS